MLLILILTIMNHAQHAPTTRPPARLELAFDLPGHAGRCAYGLEQNSDLVELDGWSVRVSGPNLPPGIVGRAKMVYRSGLVSQAKGVPGWILTALLKDKSKPWPDLLPAARELRRRWSDEDFALVRETLEFLRRRAPGWAFNVHYNWPRGKGELPRYQNVFVFLPKSTFPRGVLVAVNAADGAPELVNLRSPTLFSHSAFIPIEVTSHEMP